MHYVKHFDILGVDTAQIPCIEIQGVPNSATEGAVGLLGMNVLSDDHEIYVCVAVNGSVYTWMPLKDGKDGVSIIKTELNDNCELIITFSDGTTSNLGKIKGEKGEKGEQADLTKIQEKNEGRYLGVWLGDTETFEQLGATAEDTMYVLEDDNTLEEIDKAINNTNAAIDNINTRLEELPKRYVLLDENTRVGYGEVTELFTVPKLIEQGGVLELHIAFSIQPSVTPTVYDVIRVKFNSLSEHTIFIPYSIAEIGGLRLALTKNMQEHRILSAKTTNSTVYYAYIDKIYLEL